MAPGPSRNPTTSELIEGFLRNAQVDAEVRSRIWMSVVDTLAVTVAGSATQVVRRLETSLARTGWIQGGYSSANADVALVFGVASHALDYDDVCMRAICHPTSPVLAALVADSAALSAPLPSFLDALAVGTEVSVRIGEVLGRGHYSLGFHATSTVGVVGATAALCRIARLEPAIAYNALGIAASSAAGVRSNFGSDAKPLHVGMAAANAHRSIKLARAGLTASASVFEDEGFFCAFSGGKVKQWEPAVQLGQPFAVTSPGFELKRYPCCYLLHRVIRAAELIHRDSSVSVEQIRDVEVRVPRGALEPLIHRFPRDGAQAQFSVGYAVLATLMDGSFGLSSLGQEWVMRPEIQSRLASVVAQDNSASGVDLRISMLDGTSRAQHVIAQPGSADDPLGPSDLLAKWCDCFGYAGIPAAAARRLFDGLPGHEDHTARFCNILDALHAKLADDPQPPKEGFTL